MVCSGNVTDEGQTGLKDSSLFLGLLHEYL